MPIKVLCVDDNELVRDAITVKLRLAGGFELLEPLGDADHLIDQVRRLAPDVLLLDVDMPGRDPLEALSEVTASFPTVRALVFSGHTRRDLVDRAVEAGAWGYVSKHAPAETIVNSIRRVAAGEFVLGGSEQDTPS